MGRVLVKKILYKMFGPEMYGNFQFLGKVLDIKKKKVWEKELHLVPLIVRNGETAIDVGANYALYSYYLSKAVGESGQVYSFEPIPFTYKVCKKLLGHFNLNNVQLFDKGCGNENGKAMFEAPLQSFGAISAGQTHLAGRNNDIDGKERHYKFKEAVKVECEVVRLDDFLTNLEAVSYMKLDIEGAEFFALQGARKLIAKNHPIIQCEINPFFLNGFSINLTDLLGFMCQLGYRLYFYSYHNASHQVKEISAGDVEENNYLFIHPDRFDRVSNAIDMV